MNSLNIVSKCQGKESEEDLSYQWVEENNELYQMEAGIEIFKFDEEYEKRSPEVQFKVLEHMTQSKIHINKLYKNPIQFSYNRYNNILPFEYSMVKLQPIQSDNEAEKYINANYINTFVKDMKIIATQGPLSSTVYNFWRMIDQNNIHTIYMLCNLQERNKIKCYGYWPCKSQQKIIIPHYQLYLLEQKQVETNLLEKKIRLKGLSNQTDKIITHYHWKDWKDNEAPRMDKFYILEKLIRMAISNISKNQKIVVHCSAGIGRTGSFIAMLNITLALQYFQQKQQSDQNKRISIFGIVRRLRQQRWGMVFKKEQYQFLYIYAQRVIKKLFPMMIEEDLE